MIKIFTFIGWGLSALLFLVGITSIASQPSMAIVMILWGLLFLPPLWKTTAKFGRVGNIVARVVIFLVSPALTMGSTPQNSTSVVNSADLRDSSALKVSEVKTKKANPIPDRVVPDREIAVTAPVIPAPKPSTVEENGVNMASFKRIKPNMNYAEVVEILGKEGEEFSSTNIAGITNVTYTWSGGFMVTVTAMFQNDKLLNKTQMGLH